MLKCSHKTLIILSGLVWFAVGLYLLPLGINFLLLAIENVKNGMIDSYPLLKLLSSLASSHENSIIILTVIGLMIGYSKGRYVLGKSAIKGVERIRSFDNPTPLSNIYSLKYYILLLLMIGLGMSMKLFNVSLDIRGLVDVAIGSALINGAMIYFRLANVEQKAHAKTQVDY